MLGLTDGESDGDSEVDGLTELDGDGDDDVELEGLGEENGPCSLTNVCSD